MIKLCGINQIVLHDHIVAFLIGIKNEKDPKCTKIRVYLNEL